MKLYHVPIVFAHKHFCAPQHICICDWSWKICGPEIPPLEIRKTFDKRAGDGFETWAAHVEELNEVALVENTHIGVTFKAIFFGCKITYLIFLSILHVSFSNETNFNKKTFQSDFQSDFIHTFLLARLRLASEQSESLKCLYVSYLILFEKVKL